MAALDRLLTTRRVDTERLAQAGFGELTATAGSTWAHLLKRPEVTIEPVLGAIRESLAAQPLLVEMAAAVERGGTLPSIIRNEARAVETEIKFAGYLEQQKKSIDKLKAAEAVAIPEWIEYGNHQRAFPRNARNPGTGPPRNHRASQSHSRSDPGRALSLVHVSIRVQAHGGWPVRDVSIHRLPLKSCQGAFF